jgi:Fe-S cluster assembly protein SufD
LIERRRDFAEAFAKSPMPTEHDESFRYGRIDELHLTRFAAVSPAGGSDENIGASLLDSIGANASIIRTLDGIVSSIALSRDTPSKGVSIGRLIDGDSPPAGFGDLLADVGESLTQLAEALTADAVVIEVGEGIVVREPIVIVHEISDAAAASAIAPRIHVRLGRGAEATVVEFYQSSGAGEMLCMPVSELFLGEGSHLAYHAIQRLAISDWQLAYQMSSVERDGALRSFSAALGGSYARLLTRSDLVGEGAESRLSATYLAQGNQVQDLRTFQEHSVGRTTSDLVFKGAVRDQARSVYSGLIHIAKGAKRSVAAQSNRNLVLSEGAHADSVPNLDIEENDVRCSHASAVGPIDAEQRFYLESRGLPPEVADRLILLGFFDDLFDSVPNAGCAGYLREVFTREIESEPV